MNNITTTLSSSNAAGPSSGSKPKSSSSSSLTKTEKIKIKPVLKPSRSSNPRPSSSSSDSTTTEDDDSSTTSSSSSSSSDLRNRKKEKQQKPKTSTVLTTTTTNNTPPPAAASIRSTTNNLKDTTESIDNLIESLTKVQIRDLEDTKTKKKVSSSVATTFSSLVSSDTDITTTTTVLSSFSPSLEPSASSISAVSAGNEINLSAIKASSSSSSSCSSSSSSTSAILSIPILKPLRPYQKLLVSTIKLFYRGLIKCSCDPTTLHGLPFQPYPPLHYNEEFFVSTLTNMPPMSALIYLPTGGGKTRIATELIKWISNNNGRILFVVNRNKLILQAKEALINEGLTDIGYYASGLPIKKNASIQLATIQSLSARYRRIKVQKRNNTGNDKASIISTSDSESETDSDDDPSTEFWDTDDEEKEIIIVNKKLTKNIPSSSTVVIEKSTTVLQSKNNKDSKKDKTKKKKAKSPSSSSSIQPNIEIASLAFPKADLVIIDEAHSSIASSYLRLIRYYRQGYGSSKNIIINHTKAVVPQKEKGTKDNDNNTTPSTDQRHHKHTFLLGLTATPIRLKENEKLGHLYEILLRGPNVSELVASHVLVPPIAIRASTEEIRNTLKRKPFQHSSHSASAASSSVSRIRDYRDDGDSSSDDTTDTRTNKNNDELIKELSSTLETDTVIQHAIQMWKKHCLNRRTIVFAVDVQHSQRITKAFNQSGIPAAHIDGTLPIQVREQIYNDIANGKILVLSSVNVISEGFDEPTISAVLLLRPTQSRGLYIQQVGRGLRSAAWIKKRDCIILDFTDATFRHGPVTRPIVSDLENTNNSSSSNNNNGIGNNLSNELLDLTLTVTKYSPKAWVCPNKDCATFMHPMYKKCFRCGTFRPLPKSKTLENRSNSGTVMTKSSSINSSSSLPPQWATDLVRQNAQDISSSSTGSNKVILTIPRKIVPGLSIAQSIVKGGTTSSANSSATTTVSTATKPTIATETILSIPRLPKNHSSLPVQTNSTVTDNSIDQLSESLHRLKIVQQRDGSSENDVKEGPSTTTRPK